MIRTTARVETAPAMREALQTVTWDLILVDHVMPHFSGPAALQVLKESGQDIPLLVVSGHGQRGTGYRTDAGRGAGFHFQTAS